MVINKHGSFYLRSGWGTKIIQAINDDDMIFSPVKERDAIDKIGLGRVMIKALRYWADASGIVKENKVQGGIIGEKTDLFKMLNEKDRYFQKNGSLLLLHRNIAQNRDNATAWYWAFNEFSKQTFSKDEFVDGLHYFLAVNGMDIKVNAVEKEYNCFKNTYIGEKRFEIKTAMDEDTYPLLGPVQILRLNNEDKKIEKRVLGKEEIPLQVLIYAIIEDNKDDCMNKKQISIDKLMEEKNQIGRYFLVRYSGLIDLLMEAENKKILKLNNNFGNRYIEFLEANSMAMLEKYYEE